ncbi:MAG TPA: LpxL/LpxP family Kdo(2)-lipid IV(A) lauroyl/palmitoleoyl acyltransferase [Nevskiaceae bacterium]|nr:LpxL/LpxP family Kdo(2)-lipid IV(A) lauroyl/palmitoleoyl acyltransferase [Nevskiaceae bacterium]
MPAAAARAVPQPVPRALLAPRWWFAWVGLAMLWLLSWLPMPLVRLLGCAVGELFHAVVPSRRRVVRINLRLCFPALSEPSIRRLARAHFRALGMGFFEIAYAWFASDWRLARCTDFVGVEHLREAQADGSGVLLLTGHFTTMELGCRLVALAGFPFHGMYRPADNPFADYWMRRLRERQLGLAMVPKADLKQVVRCLRRGARVWYGPDQTLNAPNAEFIDFFGVPTLTLTATSRLTQMGRCKVVPYFPQRIGGWWSGHYRVDFGPALKAFPSGDDVADAQRINRVLEDAIRQVPEQYFWVHRRFKRQPPGCPDPYAL